MTLHEIQVSMHVFEPEIYFSTEGISESLNHASKVWPVHEYMYIYKYRCISVRKPKFIFQGKTFLSCSACFCLPRWRPVGYGVTRINTVEGKNKIKPHKTAQTQHSDGIERTETQCI